MAPGETVRFWSNGRHRAGRYVRTIARGADKGKLEISLGGRIVKIAPEAIYQPRALERK